MTEEAIDIAAPEPAELNNADPQQATEVQQEETQAEEKPQEQPWPEKAVRAHANQKRKAIELSYQNKLLKSELAELRKAVEAAKQPSAPKIEDFENKSYEDYLMALTEHKLNQRLNEGKQSQEEAIKQQQEARWIAEREDAIVKRATEFKAQVPDYDAVLQEASPIISQFPAELEKLILSLEDPVLACYNLHKEDMLVDLLDMPLPQAAVLLGKAMAKGVPPKKTVTSAPSPLRGVKGSGNPTTSLNKKSPEELLAWLKS